MAVRVRVLYASPSARSVAPTNSNKVILIKYAFVQAYERVVHFTARIIKQIELSSEIDSFCSCTFGRVRLAAEACFVTGYVAVRKRAVGM